MPKLYLKQYSQALVGKTVTIACKEGVLRDYLIDIINDIKFLNRQSIETVFCHNMANRFANQKVFRQLAAKLPQTTIVRIQPENDFYASVLNWQKKIFKIIFLERKFLCDPHGRKLNCLTTRKARNAFHSYGDLVANISFKNTIEEICAKIESNHIQRVHIVPAGRHKIKHELFAIEGAGTLIANDFQETFGPLEHASECRIVFDILKIYRSQGYLKPRSLSYIQTHQDHFFTVRIDGIIVGCVEKIDMNSETVEMGAIAISLKFRNQQIGIYLIRTFIAHMRCQAYRYIVSLTANPKLAELYRALGFRPARRDEYVSRQQQSANVPMYVFPLHGPCSQ